MGLLLALCRWTLVSISISFDLQADFKIVVFEIITVLRGQKPQSKNMLEHTKLWTE